MPRATVRRHGKSWELRAPDGALVALVCYKRGAVEIARRMGWRLETDVSR